MVFLRLGWVNARRNLTRSGVAILAMFIAAAFLTHAVSLSRGYPRAIKRDYRAVLGGEIIVYELGFGAEAPESGATWHYRTLVSSPLTDLEVFHPQLFHLGFLATALKPARLTENEVTTLKGWPGVRDVYPRYQLPAKVQTSQSFRTAPLHGRDYQLDQSLAYGPELLIVEGRWLSPEDDGELVAVVSGYQHREEGERPAEVGGTITVQLPSVVYRDGEMHFDYLHPLEKSLTVVGVLEAATRVVGPTVTRPGEELSQVYWQLDEIQIPLRTWHELWHEMGGDEYQPEQLMLIAEDTAYLEDIVQGLRSGFPEHTFFSVPEQASSAEKQRLIETYFPEWWSPVEVKETQSALQPDVRLPLAVLIFCNAALIVAANLLIMVQERKKEIGILKAVGAKRVQIVQMVLCEALLIAGVGAGGGFLLLRIPGLLNQWTNHTALSGILNSFASDMLFVALFTAIVSTLFGFLPALSMAHLSVMEVLRRE